MSASHSKPPKPERPPDDRTLFWHPSGRWCKKIRGTFAYFGRGTYADALTEYNRQKDDLHAGRLPKDEAEEVATVYQLCGRFLTAKVAQRDAGELAPRSYTEYVQTTRLLVKRFGKGRALSDLGPEDFERLRSALAKRFGPTRLANEIQRVRTVFKYGYEAGLLDRPMRFGPQFKKPSRAIMRKLRAAAGPRMFAATELRLILDYLDGKEVTLPAGNEAGEPIKVPGKRNPALRAMVLLGINAAMGNGDCAALPFAAVDLDAGWLNFPRPKTGIGRRAKLWGETTAALRIAFAERPAPQNETDAGLVFLTRFGKPWMRSNDKGHIINAVQHEFEKVLRVLHINGRHRLGFYTLRHTARTVMDATRDFPAARLVMGHCDDSMDAVYVEQIGTDRLEAVAEHVHAWVFGESENGANAVPTDSKPRLKVVG